ncbi:MAG: sulfotransferase family protein, partial [Chthoniobacterales bacterium]
MNVARPTRSKRISREGSTYRPPVFIVGSPRSGTSILTWCMAQHPNLLGLEESNWRATFAVDLAVAFRRGSARGERSQFSSMGIERDQFMQEIGAAINVSILRHRHAFEDRRLRLANPDSPENHAAFKISRDRSDLKSRWVNGTPEYSRGIGGLRKLFPAARFIHLVRDCDLVAPSMLHFDRVAGKRLVETEEQAYQYWLVCVRACVTAETAFGPEIGCRIFLEDLIRKPKESIRRILSFIGEPFAATCLEPLTKRINSSNVAAEEAQRSPAAHLPVIEARELWKTLRENPPPEAPQRTAAGLIEEEFELRVDYAHDVDAEYAKKCKAHEALQLEFDERSEWA